MIQLADRQVDEVGTVIFPSESLYSLLLKGYNIKDFKVLSDSNIERHNKICRLFDQEDLKLSLYDPANVNVTETLEKFRNNWLIPESYKAIDVREWLYGKCNRADEIERVNQEMEVFERYELLDMLRSLIYLVDVFLKNDVVWGVGRGSSVSSYVLFLIRIHSVDSIRYELDFSEFLN